MTPEPPAADGLGAPISRRRALAAAGGLLALASGGSGYAFVVEPGRIGVTRHEVPVPGLPPELDGLRLAQVTDVHLYDGLHTAARRTMEIVAGLAPDVTIFTGDSCEKVGQLAELQRMMVACRGRLATVVVMGNWEYTAGITPGQLARCAEAAGGESLYNASRLVRVGSATLALVGLDDPRAGSPDPDAALRGVPADATAIWAFHAPGYADDLRGRGWPAPAFAAAGHTHGGQLRLPPIPALTPLGSGRFVAGWYRDTFAPLYVSRGIGTTEIRARFLCPPELPLFTLRRT
jgi:predicted MPP superfamily phosphohydrolase